MVSGAFFEKSLDLLNEADLQWLVTAQVAEGERLDYKRDMYRDTPNDKKELLKDIAAFANHRGGRIVIGMDELPGGVAGELVGVPPGRHADWMNDVCLPSIDERILGLRFGEVSLANGNMAIVVDVPESQRAPHMVTFDGTYQFWRRHGRRRDRMTTDEIREAVLRVVDNAGRVERFMGRRIDEIQRSLAGKCYLVLSALPAYFRDEPMIDVTDYLLRELMARPPRVAGIHHSIGCGEPVPTIDGLRATEGRVRGKITPEGQGDYLEVFRNGYVEFVTIIDMNRPGEGLYIASQGDPAMIVSFVAFLAVFYSRHMAGTPISVRAELFNAAGIRLHYGEYHELTKRLPPHNRLDLGDFFVEDIGSQAVMLPKRICDRLWNAFGLTESGIFDKFGILQQ